MRLHPTFAVYISKQFFVWWAGVFLLLTFLIALFDTIELLRITASSEQTSLADVLAMVLFKLPTLAEKAVPFTVLFGGMMAFWRLNRYQEFVVARAAGVSAWEFLLPAILAAFLIGIIQVTVYGPFASTMMLRFETLEAENVKGKQRLAALSGKGIWLRQPLPDGHYILHGKSITPSTMTLQNPLIFRFDRANRFVTRIDADQGQLVSGAWALSNVRITGPEKPVGLQKSLSLPTDLTDENIHDSFAKPETISFWQLPGFIEVLEKAGFSGLRHRIYWYSLLAVPLLLCSMVLFAGAFTLRQQRRGGATITIAAGVATGFLIYFGSDVVYALGLSARLPAMLAGWSPAAVGCLLGTGLLFHLEDG